MKTAALVACSCTFASIALVACSAPGKPSNPERPMPQFAILMYETGDAWHRKPQAERDALLERYMAWIKELQASGAFKGGTPIGRGGTILAKDAAGAVRATAVDVDAESLTGTFIVEARDLAHAEELAEQRVIPSLVVPIHETLQSRG